MLSDTDVIEGPSTMECIGTKEKGCTAHRFAYGPNRRASSREPEGWHAASRGLLPSASSVPCKGAVYPRAYFLTLSMSYSGAGRRARPPCGPGASPHASRRARLEPLLRDLVISRYRGKPFDLLMTGELSIVAKTLRPFCESYFRIDE